MFMSPSLCKGFKAIVLKGLHLQLKEKKKILKNISLFSEIL